MPDPIPPTHPTHYGNVTEYISTEESFDDYLERIECYFVANSISDDKIKLAIFLSVVGATTYKIISSLVAPDKPREKDFASLTSTVKKHFNPTPNIIVERFKFNSRSRSRDESIADYVKELRRLAVHCDFGTGLNERLRDRLVCGVRHEQMQRRLLSEANLTLESALTLVQSMEAAQNDVDAIAQSSSQSTSSSASGKVHQQVQRKKQYDGKFKSSGQPNCTRCGKGSHKSHECRFKDAICHYCKKTGHIEAACFAKQNQPSNHDSRPARNHDSRPNRSKRQNQVREEYPLYTLSSSQASVSPYMLDVTINGKTLAMELDTGASLSIMGSEQYNELWPLHPLQPCNKVLKTYTDETIALAGSAQVKVQLNGVTTCLPIIVTTGNQPALIGRNWIRELHIDVGHRDKVLHIPISEYQTRFPTLFREGIGTIKGVTATIHIDPNMPAKYFRARPVPFSLKNKLEAEYDRLLEEEVITPVKHADWAAPVVPVLKTNGTIRVCGDYKLTVNAASQLDQYPLPHIDDVFAALSGGVRFSKIDLSQAYNQIVVEKKSRPYLTINTHRGLYEYQRLPFGVASAPGIFQRCMDRVITGVPRCVAYLDDIVVSGTTPDEHNVNLEMLLTKLSDAGVRLRAEKCEFSMDSIEYLGHRIDDAGLHPLEDKVADILDAPSPTSVTELKSFLGIINYYGKFVNNLSSILAPLHILLRKGQSWKWASPQQKAFDKAKKLIASPPVLVHYDTNKPLSLSVDASPYGIGAVLSHDTADHIKRPIGFKSRSLNAAEKNYSQLEKEALAIVFGVRRFHKYVYGRSFTITTDHKPLLGLLSELKNIPPMASPRIIRWSLFLANYDYKLEYIPGSQNQSADALSRLPRQGAPEDVPMPAESYILMQRLDESAISSDQIASMTSKDPLLSKVLKHLKTGWPARSHDELMKPYFTRRKELSLQNGCILWGSRVVVPPQARDYVFKSLHTGHPGIVKMNSAARSFCWWPGIAGEISMVVGTCEACQAKHVNPPREEPQPWPETNRPWARVHIDFAGPVAGSMFLILVDSHSKWLEVLAMTSTTTTATIEKLRRVFSANGLPDQIVSDNGPQFSSTEFAEFMQRNGIEHLTSAPYHPQSNGLAERAVRTFKAAFTKETAGSSNTKLSRFLLSYRTTPHCTTGKRPDELFVGRSLTTVLDRMQPRKHDDPVATNPTRRSAKVGDPVYVKLPGTNWVPGVVLKRIGSVMYQIQLSDGRVLKKHINQLRNRVAQRDEHFATAPADGLNLPIRPAVPAQAADRPANQAADVPADLAADPPADQPPEVPADPPADQPPDRPNDLPRRSGRMHRSPKRLGSWTT